MLFFTLRGPSDGHDMLLNNQVGRSSPELRTKSERILLSRLLSLLCFILVHSLSTNVRFHLSLPPNGEPISGQNIQPPSGPASRPREGMEKQNKQPSTSHQASSRDPATHPRGQPDGVCPSTLVPPPLPRLAKIGAGRLLRPPCLDNPHPLIPSCPPVRRAIA